MYKHQFVYIELPTPPRQTPRSHVALTVDRAGRSGPELEIVSSSLSSLGGLQPIDDATGYTRYAGENAQLRRVCFLQRGILKHGLEQHTSSKDAVIITPGLSTIELQR